MSNYTKAVDFAAKDALAPGNIAKAVLGTEIGAEFDAIATAVATKGDYAANTWTPAIAFNDVTTGITYTSRSGKYTKVGRLVVAEGSFLLSSKGAAVGAVIISGLPFPVSGTPVATVGYFFNLVGLTGAVTGYGADASSAITIMQTAATATTALTDANFGDTSQMTFSIVYFAAS